MTQLGPGTEFDLIRAMVAHWGALAVGIGDDASVLAPTRGEQLVISTDSALEQVHFRADWLSLHDSGYRSVTAALSDLAAMAAEPRGVLLALTIPPELQDRLLELADGIAEAVRDAGTVILGGNLAHGASLGITTTVVGSAYAPLPRSGARAGDLIYVTGALGGPSAALRALQSGATPPAALQQRFARPAARIREARWLAARGAVAALDISDGLAGDAAHLAAASGVAIEIQVERLPRFAGASEDDALAGGEEYELLVAARTPFDVEEFHARFGIPLTAIGRVGAGPVDVSFARDGKRVAAPRGYDHFSR
jgi:thiamine-monophosphate kinase